MWSCSSKDLKTFMLEGIIQNATDSTEVRLDYLIKNKRGWLEVSDTTYVKNGQFLFKGHIQELTIGHLIFDDNMIDISVYLEPTNIKMKIDKNEPYLYEFSGTTTEKENQDLRNTLLTEIKSSYSRANRVNDLLNQLPLYGTEPKSIDSLMQLVLALKEENINHIKIIDSLKFDFVKKHNYYKIAPDILYQLSKSNTISSDSIESVYNNISGNLRNTLLGQLAFDQMEETKIATNRKDILIGDIAPNFSRVDMLGKTIKLSDYRNKSYVLLDFWASWCAPCINEIPTLTNIHEKYNNKNLKIIGISLDENEEKWRNAIEQFQIGIYPQILGDSDSENNYFINANDIDEIYNITRIPVYILIDKQGEIIARWQHIGDEKIKFIDNLFSDLDVNSK